MEFILSPRLLQPAALAGWRALLSHQYLSWVSDSGSSKNESSAPPKNGDQYSNLWFDTSLPKGRQNRDKQHESINVRKRQQPGQKKNMWTQRRRTQEIETWHIYHFSMEVWREIELNFHNLFSSPFSKRWLAQNWINWVCFDFAIELPDSEKNRETFSIKIFTTELLTPCVLTTFSRSSLNNLIFNYVRLRPL